MSQSDCSVLIEISARKILLFPSDFITIPIVIITSDTKISGYPKCFNDYRQIDASAYAYVYISHLMLMKMISKV